MKILFMGSPEFACPCLSACHQGAEVVEVWTQPDRVRGRRGNKLIPTAVKNLASELEIPVWTPISLREPEVLPRLKRLAPDLIVVVAYAHFLPSEILELPALGCVNVHPSLLPLYRGASPIESALLAGDEVTGVTLYQMDEGWDTGDILLSRPWRIHPFVDGKTLSHQLSLLSKQLLLDLFKKYARHESLTRFPQPDRSLKWAYTRRWKKEDLLTRWSLGSGFVERQVRAFGPEPGLRGLIRFEDGKELLVKIGRVEPVELKEDFEAGELCGVRADEGPLVSCGGREAVCLLQVKPAGKKWMSGWSLIQGYQLEKRGARFVVEKDAIELPGIDRSPV